MKFLRQALTLTAGLLIGVVLGYFLWGRPTFAITFTNHAKQDLHWIQIRHNRGVELVDYLKVGQSRTIEIYSPGESGYDLVAEFADGKRLEREGAYAQPGSHFSEVVTDGGF